MLVMTEPDRIDRGSVSERRSRSPAKHREQVRVGAAAFIGALVAAFAVLNLDDVKVHWLVTTGHTPLIVVIVLGFVLGVLADRLLIVRSRRARRAAK
jgi:uncharacterized integral membrane protein